MIKKSIMIMLTMMLCTSCVSTKVYKDLEGKYTNLKRENRRLEDDLGGYKKSSETNKIALDKLNAEYEKTKAERDQLERDYALTKSKYDNLVQSYDALETNSSLTLAENSQKNRELLQQLEAKEKALSDEKSRLEKLQKDLALRSERIDELEEVIAAKDAKMQSLKEAISRALTDFEGKGLTVEERDGKVYVSMENKLLFNPGSWAVGTQGKKAVQQLGNVLAANLDIAVLIEGHTDNDPYTGGNGILKGNWDLSTKRATAIVTILMENKNIDAQSLTAAGRGEFIPVATNDTPEGKAKNRRIEVILTPKLDAITKLLETM